MLKITLSVFLLFALAVPTIQGREIGTEPSKCVEMFPNYAQSFASLLTVLNSENMSAIVDALKENKEKFNQLALDCNIRTPDFPVMLGNSRNCLRGITEIKPLLERITNFRQEQGQNVSGYVLLVSSIAGLANRIPRTIGDCTLYVNTNNNNNNN